MAKEQHGLRWRKAQAGRGRGEVSIITCLNRKCLSGDVTDCFMRLLHVQAAADRARQEVLFWKNELDDTVAEKNSWKTKFYDIYHEMERVRQDTGQLHRDNEELKFILERTMQADLRTIKEEAKPSCTPCASASAIVSTDVQVQYCFSRICRS